VESVRAVKDGFTLFKTRCAELQPELRTTKRIMRDRPQKITFAEKRDMGVRGVLIYCADYRCSHSTVLNADHWPDHVRLSDIEPRFVCQACGERGADVRPDFNWNRQPSAVMRHRCVTF
jgi:hypothetical protein